MAVKVYGQHYIGDSAPSEDPVQVGSIWVDTANNLLKRCTSVSPYTWASTEGGAANHDILSASHVDSFSSDTPADGEVLTWVAANSRWESTPAGAGSTHAVGSASTLTISSGQVTKASRYHLIDTEGAASSDELAGIAGGSDGDILLIRPAADGRTVVLKHEGTEETTAANRLNLPGDSDISLDDQDDLVALLYDGGLSRWVLYPFLGARHGDLGGVASDQHHSQSHAHDGVDGSGTVAHGDLTGVGSDQHHAKAHKDEHKAGGSDTLDHFELGGLNSDNHHAQNHASRHADGGADELAVQDLASDAATDGQVAKADGAGGVAFEDDGFGFSVTFYNGGSVLATGVQQVAVELPYAGEFESVRLVAIDGATGSIVVDIWKDTYANLPPTDADSITASAQPTISSATKSEDATLTGWTTTFSAGDWLIFNIDSVSTFTVITLSLRGRRT